MCGRKESNKEIFFGAYIFDYVIVKNLLVECSVPSLSLMMKRINPLLMKKISFETALEVDSLPRTLVSK
jgi:hypothetical protein